MTYFLLLCGLLFLICGGELLVRGATAVAIKFKVSPLLIGLTLVGFGTSMPELVTSVEAAFANAPGIAVGNVIGSNIANALLIMGLAAMIMPVTIQKNSLKRDGIALAIATIMCLIAVRFGHLTNWIGMIFLACLAAYIFIAFQQERNQVSVNDDMQPKVSPAVHTIFPAIIMVIAGFVLTIAGAKFLVQSSIILATALGVSKTVIGLTIVAVGTSLPELVISVVAALRGQSALAFGNVIGSNIYNIFGILGVTALIKPIEVPPQIRDIDIWVLGATTVFLLIAAFTNRRISRAEGSIMLIAYLAYALSLTLRVAA
ncbi:MAG: calcium/sodium antiporter [Acidimicrobiales bacterium]|nr:calcium/sodium antiporter [Hyphomonadaceae bacterium]RZV42155.1 MAG: calcium/sodium antiporter [Acidimicrobiales bacterium]